MNCSTPSFPVSHHLPEFVQVYVNCISDVVQPSHPLMPSSPSALNLSQHQGLFQWVFFRIIWPKYWNFSLSISPSNEYSGLISLMIDCLIWSPCSPRDSQESSPAPQFKGINSLVFCLLYSLALSTMLTTGKTIVLTIQTFVGRVISLLFNTLSRSVISNQFTCPVVPVTATWCRCWRLILCRPASSTHRLLT